MDDPDSDVKILKAAVLELLEIVDGIASVSYRYEDPGWAAIDAAKRIDAVRQTLRR